MTSHRTAVVLLVLFLFTVTAQSATILYGITTSNLVTINPSDPSQISVVGPTGLSGQGMARPISLTWNPQDGFLYGVGYDQPTGQPRDHQYLFRVDPRNGAGTLIRDLGDPDVYKFMGVEYIDPSETMVVTAGPNGTQNELWSISTAGDTTLLWTSSHINHWAAYDSSLGVFFTVQVEGLAATSWILRTDLLTGAYIEVGGMPYPLAGDVAYNSDDGFMYGATWPAQMGFPPGGVSELYRIWTTEGGAPIGYVSTGPIAGDQVFGIAFGDEVPEPASCWLVGWGIALMVWASRACKIERRRRCLASASTEPK